MRGVGWDDVARLGLIDPFRDSNLSSTIHPQPHTSQPHVNNMIQGGHWECRRDFELPVLDRIWTNTVLGTHMFLGWFVCIRKDSQN